MKCTTSDKKGAFEHFLKNGHVNDRNIRTIFGKRVNILPLAFVQFLPCMESDQFYRHLSLPGYLSVTQRARVFIATRASDRLDRLYGRSRTSLRRPNINLYRDYVLHRLVTYSSVLWTISLLYTEITSFLLTVQNVRYHLLINLPRDAVHIQRITNRRPESVCLSAICTREWYRNGKRQQNFCSS